MKCLSINLYTKQICFALKAIQTLFPNFLDFLFLFFFIKERGGEERERCGDWICRKNYPMPMGHRHVVLEIYFSHTSFGAYNKTNASVHRTRNRRKC